jgi:choline dehydrogenase-like flavoprotein
VPVSKPSVIVVGSGAGGSVAAWELSRAGHPVVVFEKGRNLLPGLGTEGGVDHIPFGNDEIKPGRFFENHDPHLEPRTGRSQDEANQGVERSFIGDINGLPTTVGGGTIHWDAKVPRFWRQDFTGLSSYGPVPGANIADWPLTYDELAPFYDEVEAQMGVQGDVTKMPASTLAQAPRSGQFPLPPNPPMYAGLLLAQGAASLGYTAYPFPMAVNSATFDGRPACNSCGFCSGFGCPTSARGGAAVSFLHHALLAGAELRTRCFVHRVELSADRTRAIGVAYFDQQGNEQHERADIVILAPSAIETARLALLSELPDPSGQLGCNIMFHFFTIAGSLFPDPPHPWRGPSSTHTIDDFVGPDTPPEAAAAGLPYLKGGICEVGGSIAPGPVSEAAFYSSVPGTWGQPLKELMRTAVWRTRISGLSMVGEDLPQLANRVDLDPGVRDVFGQPAPRVTHSAHQFEIVASAYYGPKLAAVCAAAPGAIGAAFIPIATAAEQTGGFGSSLAGPSSTAHIMGTARMGHDPASSVLDAWNRFHALDNVYAVDGSAFVSSGGFNPTITIMALALRAARNITGGSAPLPRTGGDDLTVVAGAALAAAAATRYASRSGD